MHVLSTPPAFVLSQDQTLRRCQPTNHPNHRQPAETPTTTRPTPTTHGQDTTRGTSTPAQQTTSTTTGHTPTGCHTNPSVTPKESPTAQNHPTRAHPTTPAEHTPARHPCTPRTQNNGIDHRHAVEFSSNNHHTRHQPPHQPTRGNQPPAQPHKPTRPPPTGQTTPTSGGTSTCRRGTPGGVQGSDSRKGHPGNRPLSVRSSPRGG